MSGRFLNTDADFDTRPFWSIAQKDEEFNDMVFNKNNESKEIFPLDEIPNKERYSIKNKTWMNSYNSPLNIMLRQQRNFRN